MKNYLRWATFGLVAVGIIALLLLLGANKNLRQRLTALLLEKKVKTEIQGLQEQAANARAKAQANQISAEAAEATAKATEEAISKQKQALQAGLEQRGANAEEIASRFRNLGV
jgi:ABC-type lipoprotein release transport system permease subunit